MPPVPSHSGNANVAEICNQDCRFERSFCADCAK
jgi:hypothetical protein